MTEEIVTFVNNGYKMYGVVHVPNGESPGSRRQLGILILHAGRQARAGPHRLYVKVARALCQAGLYVFRYDGRGYGDSEGPEIQTFDEWMADALSAMSFFSESYPLDGLVIWGLCGGAVLAVHCAAKQPARIDSLVLCSLIFNPDRLLYKRPLRAAFSKLLPFVIGLKHALRSPGDYLTQSAARLKRLWAKARLSAESDRDFDRVVVKYMKSLPQAFSKAAKPTFFIFGTADPVVGSFKELFDDRRWRRHLAGIPTDLFVVEGADHNFTSVEQEKSMIARTVDWTLARVKA